MLYYVNKKYFKSKSRPKIHGFGRCQMFTLGSETERVRLCSFMRYGLTMEDYNLNVKSTFDKETKSMRVLIRSTDRNKWDATIVLFAVPYNGMLIPDKSKKNIYRFREVVTIPINEGMIEEYPELKNYEKIAYGIAEVHTSVLDSDCENHVDKIFINIISKDGENSSNCSIMVSKNRRYNPDNPDEKPYYVSSRLVDGWRTGNETPTREIPYTIYGYPAPHRNKNSRFGKAKNAKHIKPKDGSCKRSKSSTNRGGYSCGYNESNKVTK